MMPLGAVDYYWDRNVVSTWEELIKYLPQIVNRLWREIDSLRNQDQALSSVLTVESERRYRILFETLLEHITHAKDSNTVPIVQWIILGSLLEATMQILLQVYLHDYNKSSWQQWVSFDSEKVTKPLFQVLRQLYQSGTINKEQKDSLKNAISDKIKEHIKKQEVPRMMLDDLIQFYSDESILSKNTATSDIKMMRKIQQNRNSIHLILDRDIADIEELRKALHFYGCLLDDFIFQFPDI